MAPETDRRGQPQKGGVERGAVHGGDIWQAARDLGREVGDIVDLSASLNPLGPPPGLKEEMTRAWEQVCHYPDRQAMDLRQALARHLGLDIMNILPGNGSTSLIRLLARWLDLKSICVLAPVFGEFPRALALAGRHFYYHHLSEQNGFLPTKHEFDEIWKEDPSGMIITNPQTPTGGLVDTEVLDHVLQQASRRGAWLVVDEAFMDFAPEEARSWAPKRAPEYKKLIVLRSMTKFFCMAGLRLGYMLCHAETLPQLAPLGEPWSVNTLAQKAGVFCLEQEQYAQKTRQAVDVWRREMTTELQGMGLKVFPSQVNYLLTLLPVGGPTAAQVSAACAARGVLVRDCASFTNCGERHLRLAVAPPEETSMLYPVLREALGGASG